MWYLACSNWLVWLRVGGTEWVGLFVVVSKWFVGCSCPVAVVDTQPPNAPPPHSPRSYPRCSRVCPRSPTTCPLPSLCVCISPTSACLPCCPEGLVPSACTHPGPVPRSRSRPTLLRDARPELSVTHLSPFTSAADRRSVHTVDSLTGGCHVLFGCASPASCLCRDVCWA